MSEISYGGIPSRPSPGKRRPFHPHAHRGYSTVDSSMPALSGKKLCQPEPRVTVRFRSSALMIRVSETQIA
jgi:hypothetical protein